MDLVQELWARVHDDPAPATFWVVSHAGNREVRYHDHDGVIRALSIKKAVECNASAGPKPKRVLRYSLDKHIEHFKRDLFDAGPVYCAISGVELTPDVCEIDHYGDQVFADIAEAWLAKIGGFQNVALKNPRHARSSSSVPYRSAPVPDKDSAAGEDCSVTLGARSHEPAVSV